MFQCSDIISLQLLPVTMLESGNLSQTLTLFNKVTVPLPGAFYQVACLLGYLYDFSNNKKKQVLCLKKKFLIFLCIHF